MPNQTFNSAEFVRLAYSTFGIINQNDDLDDQKYSDGLTYLNMILGKDQANGMMIPAISNLQFNLTPGQDFYEVSQNLTADVTHNYFMDLTRASIIYTNLIQYQIDIVTAEELLGSPLSLNTNSWPSQLYLYKYKAKPVPNTYAPLADMQSCVLRFYPVPSMAFPVIIYGKSILNSVTKNTNVDVPSHFFMYLLYALGELLTRRFENSVWKPEDSQTLLDLRDLLTAGNEIDRSLAPSPTLRGSSGNNPMATNVA